MAESSFWMQRWHLRTSSIPPMDSIAKSRVRLNPLLLQVPAEVGKFPGWLWRRLSVIPLVFEQQTYMFDTRTHVCEEWIVSFQQPHVRPINRGKRPAVTGFGQKLH